MPNIDHRCCIRHMHANFKNDGPNKKTLNEIMWDTNRAYKKHKHPYCTDSITSTSNNMHEFRSKFDARDWFRNVVLLNI